MTEPTTNRWLQTRMPGKVGILMSILTAFVAGTQLFAFMTGGNALFLVAALVIFALFGWSFASSVTKLRRERAASQNSRPDLGRL